MGKAWPALDIHVPGCDPQLQDLVLAELDDFHPTAIQENTESDPLRAFFENSGTRDAAAHALAAAFGTHLFVETVNVDDEDWAARSQADLEPVTVGKITILPERKRGTGAVPLFLVIRPSMGFGTGHHATTRLMLKALQTINAADVDVLDIGCGSGVLAIAAVRLGARSATAVDVDPDALESAAENVTLNDVDDRVRLQQADFRTLDAPAPIVLANLTGALLESSAQKLASLTALRGHLIVSGFMDTETSVVPTLQKFLELQHVEHEDEWRCAVFCKGSGL